MMARSLKPIRAEGVETEIQAGEKAACRGRRLKAARERVRAEKIIHRCEHHVHYGVSADDYRKEHGPACIDEMQVGMNIAPAGAPSHHVEAPVFVDHAAQAACVLLREAGIKCRLPHENECTGSQGWIRRRSAT